MPLSGMRKGIQDQKRYDKFCLYKKNITTFFALWHNLLMIKRRYLELAISEDLATKMVFVAGPRQVGKTTMAKSLLERANHGRYLNWDNRNHRREIRNSAWPATPSLVVLDELHKWHGWKSWIKGEFDVHHDRIRFLITGSARLDLYRTGGDSLQGRYHHYRLHPFTLTEIERPGHDLPAGDLDRELDFSSNVPRSTVGTLMQFGGFPEPFLAQSARTLRRWQKERVDRVLLEDVRDLEEIRAISRIQILADLLPERVGSPLSVNSLREDLDASHRAVSHWVDILDRLYYSFRIFPWAARRVRSLKRMPKLYLWDWSEVPDEGARFENLVAVHLLKFCHFIEDREGYRVELRYLRDRDGREVDFLVTRRLDDSSFFEMLLASSKEIAVVTSCDRECFNLFSLVASQKEDWTVSSPWPGHPRPDYLNHSYYVGFNAQEVIIGSNRAERCLEALVASRTPPELIVYMDSCLHRIVGVDSRSFLERLQEKSRVPIVYYDIRTSQHPYLQQLKDFWRSLFQQLDESTSTSDPAGVVLLGVGTPEWLGLDDVCQRLGWRVLGHVFPSLDSAAVRNISRSSVLVANCWEYVRVIFSDMVKDLSQPLLSLPIPYGIEGTSQWLEKIHSRLLGEPPPLEGIDEIQSAGESFNRIRGDIAGRSVGLFSRWPGADIRLSPRIRFGVPLVDFFHELGLRICLHLYLASEEGEPAVDDVAARVGLKLDAGDEVVFFRSSSQLDELLLRGEFDLVFTEMLRDRRISRAGKIPLSVKQLHPGYTGAVRTARFIQGLLASGFYRRYRGMPVAHGERLPPRGGN